MSGPRYPVGKPVPNNPTVPKSQRRDLGYRRELGIYAYGTRKTASGRKAKGTWSLHATKGWKKRA